MICFAFLAVVHAGQWLPEQSVELLADQPILIEQSAGRGLLLRPDDTSVLLSAEAEGLNLILKAGPNQSLLLPPALRSRTLSIQADGPTRLRHWVETQKGDAAAWDRYESNLARWMRKGGELPVAPAAVAALEVDWEARREAYFARHSRVSPGLLMGFASLELEAHRARSKADHSVTVLPSGRLPDGEPWNLSLSGPAVLQLDVRAEMDGQLHRRFSLRAESGGEVIHHRALSSVENPEFPGLGNLRKVEIVIPPGTHELLLRAEGADLRIDAGLYGLRPPLRSLLGRWGRSRRESQDALTAMEQAHLSWNSTEAVSQARALLAEGIEATNPLALLASARLIQHLPSAEEALEFWEAGPRSAVGGTALLRRWQLRGDVPLDVLVDAAELLPADPDWLAEIADALPAGFIRPRGQAIRELAGLPWGSDTHSRWTALDPDKPLATLHLAGSRGGIGRVLIRGGQSAKVQLPILSEGRLPLLRLYTEVVTDYAVDGEMRRGKGSLFEALSPGIHSIEVFEGALLLLDGKLAIGGQFMRERPLSGIPGRFVLPDTGAPLEVEVLISGGQGTLYARTDTGETWALHAKEKLNRYALQIGAWSSALHFEGDPDLRVSVAMRRALEIDEPFASPEVLRNPLASLRSSSEALHTAESPSARVALRLLRAAALESLGLLRSAREEARAAAGIEGATPRQKRIAEVILREAQPLAFSAEEEGPTTLDAAAASIRMEAPTHADALKDLAEILGPPDNAPVLLDLAQTALADGRVADAWIHASESGPSGRVQRLRIASAGHWEHITRVNKTGGVEEEGVGRIAAGLGASPLRLAKEALVGAPWPAQDYLLLHDNKAAQVELDRPGALSLEMICTDWEHRSEAPPCVFPVQLNGVRQIIEIPSDSQLDLPLEFTDSQGTLHVGPLPETGHALALRVSQDDRHIPPQSRHVRHQIGDGIQVRVRGESLLRVRVHGAAPVHARAGDQSVRIQGEGILPLPNAGWQEVSISGASGMHVSLSRLAPRARPRVEQPSPLRSSLSGTADEEAGKATQLWMSEVALQPRLGVFPVGSTGTFSVAGLGGLEQSGQRDHRLDYVYGGTHLAWRQRLGPRPDWLQFQTQIRGGPSGHPSAWGEAEWVHVTPRWASELRLDGGYSGGAFHVQGDGRFRGTIPLGRDWVLQPWIAGGWGYWSEGVGDPVDPLVWNSYDADHFRSLTAGTMGDWRPLRDARLRLAAHVRTTPNLGLNWTEGFLRADFLLGHNTIATVLPALGYRFASPLRSEPYWRPRLEGRLALSAYASPRLRVELSSAMQWLPLQDGLEGGISLSFQASPRRGLRDFSPLSTPFTSALDSRVEDQ